MPPRRPRKSAPRSDMQDFVFPKRGRRAGTPIVPPAPVENPPSSSTSDIQAMIAASVAKEVSASVAKEVKAALDKFSQPQVPGHFLNQDGAPQSQIGTSSTVLPTGPLLVNSKHSAQSPPTSSLQQSVSEVFGSDLSMLDTRVTFDVPLGATLSQKLRAKIVQREYIELYLLLDPSAEEDRDNDRESRPCYHPARKVKDINQWLSAMHIFGAVYLQHNQAEVAPFFKYLEIVRGMDTHTNNNSWRTYDETFRRARQWSPLPWDRPLVHQYVAAMLLPSAVSSVNVQGKQKKQPFLTAAGNPIPRSFCFSFNTTGCSKPACTYLHRCPKCRSESHRVDDCRQQSNGQPSHTASNSRQPHKQK